MDMETMLKLMMGNDALGQVSEQAGISQSDAAQVIESIVPILLKGMQGQFNNKETKKSFVEALDAHGKDDTSDVGKFLKNVDKEDGAKIVNHLLGKDTEELAAKANKKSGIDTKTIIKIMAIVAPLLMSQMGKSAKTTATQTSGSGASDMIEIVGGLMDGIDAKDIFNIARKLIK